MRVSAVAPTGGRRSVGLALALLSCLAVLPATPALGSQSPDAEAPSAEVRDSAKRFDRPGGAGDTTSTHFWTWSKGARGYFLSTARTGDGYERLTAVDLESGAQLATETLSPRGYEAPGDHTTRSTRGSDRSMTVDEDGGRLFVATQVPEFPKDTPTQESKVCARVEETAGTFIAPCLWGVSVIDAQTLQQVRHIPVAKVQADGAVAAMELLTMAYSPPEGDWGAKVHLVVQETAHTADSLVLNNVAPRTQSAALIYLVQVDVDNGRVDWRLRLDACRGNLRPNTSDFNNYYGYRHQAAVMRSLGDAPAVYVACHFVSQTFQGGVVRVPLDAAGNPPPLPVGSLQLPESGVPTWPSGEDPAPPAPQPGDRVTWINGPERVFEMIPDPSTGRIVLQVLDGGPPAEVWWVFDTATMRFVGTVGIGGPTALGSSLAALDEGRLYVLARPASAGGRAFEGGFFVADIGTTPVSQALLYPQFASRLLPNSTIDRWALTVQRLPDGARRLWYPAQPQAVQLTHYQAIEDHRPRREIALEEDYAGRTLDLDEAEGVTGVSYDGAARGYGVRALLVGGVDAAARVGPVDPVGGVDQCNDPFWEFKVGKSIESSLRGLAATGAPGSLMGTAREDGGPCYYLDTPVSSPCAFGDREIVAAAVGPQGPAVVDGTGARGAAEPLRIDSLTTADAEAPASRCAGQDWDQIWGTALFGRAPAGEPQVPVSASSLPVECVSGSAPSARSGDPVASALSASVACESEEAVGHAYARGVAVRDVGVAEAISSFRIYRDPGRGIVSRVESVARGVDLFGVLRIDTVRGVAESWANGRRQGVDAAEREPGYESNCDFERSAGSCFTRHLLGVWTPEWSCGPCGDEHAFLDAVNGVLNPLGMSAALREPDLRLREGAENGFIAAIQKPEADRFGDMVLNSDLLQTVLPTFEVVRQASPNRTMSRGGARGRQIYQFAGVEVSSSYGISCLLVYDEATNTCAAPSEPPGAIQVSLSDSDGQPLAGGAFEVRADVDADGVLGLKDTLLANGACVTAADGVGTCKLDNLQPGTYLVAQVAAPPGYAKSAEPFVVELASGEQRTVAFTNVSNVSTVDIKATDEAGAPLSGAVFAAYPDPDSDGKVAPEAKPAAECTTDGQGACQMKVPAGSYVLVQTSAPGGLEGIEPVAFTFASGGQVAAVSVVNYPPNAPQAPEAPASPIYTPPVDMAPPTEIVDDSYVAPTEIIAPDVAPAPNLPERIGGTVTQVIRAPGDALRLLARDPKQAVAWTAALALFVLAAMAVRRRQHVMALINI